MLCKRTLNSVDEAPLANGSACGCQANISESLPSIDAATLYEAANLTAGLPPTAERDRKRFKNSARSAMSEAISALARCYVYWRFIIFSTVSINTLLPSSVAYALPTKTAVLVAAHDHFKHLQETANNLMQENKRLTAAMKTANAVLSTLQLRM